MALAAEAGLARVVLEDGTEFHHCEAGKGRPLVFVHGGMGDWSSWQPQWADFVRHYRCISYSRRFSSPNRNRMAFDDHSVRREAQDLAALLRAWSARPAILVATSYGAYTALAGSADDLSSSDSLLWTDPLAPRAGDAADVGLVVNRQGGKQVIPNVKVNFYVGDPDSGGVLLGAGTIDLLSPRSSASTSAVPWAPAAPGSYLLVAIIDPDNAVVESLETNNRYERRVAVLPPAADQLAPRVDAFAIDGGAAQTQDQAVALSAALSDPPPSSGFKSLYFQEYEYSPAANQWVPVRNSGWLDYDAAKDNHPWTLLPSAGVKYLQAWGADRAGNISLFPYRAYINYGPPTDRVMTNQGRIYRYELQPGDRLDVELTTVTGDADLYVWPPNPNAPPWVSNLAGAVVDDYSIPITVAGVYQIEVYGYTTSDYRLAVNVTPAGRGREFVPRGGVDPEKPERGQPIVAVTSVPANQQGLPTAPAAPDAPPAADPKLYLPVVAR